ncbi:MAG TPA: polyprenyl synthetase family protein [Candidatus Sulfotelmatobacter sp.]|nr:polyprenyl synthetase family protein [Candidatus Sulfotelmatobacter sp.]
MVELGTQNGLFTIIARELEQVEARLRAPATESRGLLAVVVGHGLASGGKRIRPALLLLAARACGATMNGRHVELAAATEMMHAATLIHDDIVDNAATRRGLPSAMARWGSHVSVLVGDFLFSRAIQTLVADSDFRIMGAFSQATVSMTAAEVLQLQLLHDLAIGESEYLEIVTGKTAALMSAACRAGALAAGASESRVEALAAFGLNLGIGFQLVDDALDYIAREERLGKPVGSDFREGKITYPVIHILRRASAGDRALLERLVEQPALTDDDLLPLRDLVERYEAVPATMRLVDDYLGRARVHLELLPDTPACQALHRLSEFVRERDW